MFSPCAPTAARPWSKRCRSSTPTCEWATVSSTSSTTCSCLGSWTSQERALHDGRAGLREHRPGGGMTMPYTLMKGLGWFLAALVIGIVIGWLIRSVTARRQLAKARSQHPDTVELERLRGRISNLEPVVAERDRLRAELGADRTAPPPTPPETSLPDVPVAPDVAAASAVLGRTVVPDDLTVIAGIGP